MLKLVIISSNSKSGGLIMRKIVFISIACLMGLFLISNIYAKEKTKVLAKGETKGIFLKIEWGDYAHFVIKDIKGKEQDYFIMKMDPKTLTDLQKNKKYKGQKVIVSWQKIKTYIPEAGGDQVITELVKFKFYK